MNATKKAQIEKVADWIVNDCLDVKSDHVFESIEESEVE
mgnify:CR=1 FL=1